MEGRHFWQSDTSQQVGVPGVAVQVVETVVRVNKS
jgi:hypothetical protein